MNSSADDFDEYDHTNDHEADEYAPIVAYSKRTGPQIMAWILIALMIIPVIGLLIIWIFS